MSATLHKAGQPPAAVQTLGALFAWRVAASPEAPAYRQFHPASGAWTAWNWAQIDIEVGAWRRALAALNLAPGARVASLLPNSVNAVCLDLAALSLGLVPVPLHALDNPASIAYILGDSDASVLVAANLRQWQAIETEQADLPCLRLVVLAQGDSGPAPGPGPLRAALEAWLMAAPAEEPLLPKLAPSALAALVYTSGTTGKPKGVMLSHHNILSNVRAVQARVAVLGSDVFLSFLPLSHTFERTIGYYLPLAAGASVAFARGPAQLAEDMLAIRPTVLVSVPRIYEKVYAALETHLASSAPLRRWLFDWAWRCGWRRFCARQGMPGARAWWRAADALAWPLLERLVARQVRARFGGRLRAAVSGGAPLPAAVAHCLIGLGLPILQGYGMTETAPVVSANALENNWPATVGAPLEGVKVRIGANGELQVRADSVMQAYWKRPEDSAKAIDAEGWLSTGDQAVLEAGRLRIVGRIKDLIVTSTGEKIAAADLEQAILADPLFEQVLVVGEQRRFISVVVVLQGAAWAALAAQLRLDPARPELANQSLARKAILARLKLATRAMPHFAAPRAVWVAQTAWTVENSLLTPTLKPKRRALLAHYAGQIETMYAYAPTELP